MAKRFKILTDEHFPYHFDFSDIYFTRLDRKLKRGWFRIIPSFIILYYLSFNTDIIMTARKAGKFLGLLYYLKKPARPCHIIYEFIYEPEKSLRGLVSLFIWKIAVKKLDKVFVQSTAEINYYSGLFKVGREKFLFVPVAAPEVKDFIGPTPDGYLFSGGQTQRDFQLLLKAISSLEIPCKIIARKKESPLFIKKPNHLQVYFDVSKKEYYNILSKSRLVIIPLKEGISSRGQVALLEAMAMGKPVICTDVPCIRDYLIDGINGFLVPPGDEEILKKTILSLYNDEKLLNEIGLRAYKSARERLGTKNFRANFFSFLKNVKKI